MRTNDSQLLGGHDLDTCIGTRLGFHSHLSHLTKRMLLNTVSGSE